MFDDLLSRPKPGADKSQARTAVAALLVEAARTDGQFDAAERNRIERLLERRFRLEAEAARQLFERGATAQEGSVQLFGFTQTLNERWTAEERTGLIEMLWEVALADGELDPLEDTLLRRVGGLLDVPDRERGLARQRVEARLGRSGS
jgi:uncharacterized tellurite resistance protein B-like protein